MIVLYGNPKENRYIKLNDFSIVFTGILLSLFAGFRSDYVGTDTSNYIYYFDVFARNQTSYIRGNLEIGFFYLQKIALLISSDYWSILLVIALLSVFLYFFTIQKLSVNIRLSIFLFLTLAIYLFFFNGARQGIAISIASISTIYVIRKKMWWFLTCIVLASFFHRTALIMIPFYFILRRPYNKTNLILYLIIGFLSFTLISKITSLFDDEVAARYNVYNTRGARGGELLSLFFIGITIFLIKIRKQIHQTNLKFYDTYLNFCLFNSIIYLVVLITASDVNFIRLTNYFSIGFVLIWPIVFKDVNLFKQQSFKILFVFLHVLFYGFFIFKMAHLNPYILNSNIF
jgi:hypothetical protein